jgi:hypothetical protein
MTEAPEHVVDRIRKLLALSASENPHEAALAAERATDIALKYNLDLARVGRGPTDPYQQVTVDVGAGAAWRWLLMSSIARAHFCRALRQRGPGVDSAEMFLIGETHNLDLCRFLYYYLEGEIERLAANAWARANYVYGAHVEARRWKTDFRRGAVTEIESRLRDRAERFGNQSADARALVVHKEAALADAVERFHPVIAMSSIRFHVNQDAYQSGRSAARAIPINRPVGSSPGLGQRSLSG